MALPVLFVLDRDRKSLDVLLSDLSGRFGNDFTVKGKTGENSSYPETIVVGPTIGDRVGR
ncbi:MAG: hypothetical protein M3025_09110 [Actinomycetota bacterium]|nr:hypothetical protein [Actinomycetota bacterium]